MTKKTLKDYMSPAQRASLGSQPTWHTTCMDLFKVARPGKTARDKAKRGDK